MGCPQLAQGLDSIKINDMDLVGFGSNVILEIGQKINVTDLSASWGEPYIKHENIQTYKHTIIQKNNTQAY